MGIVVKCFQSNRSSVQSLQSPHPTHHIFNFTTFPIGHTPNTKRSLSMPSERTVTIRSHTPQTAPMKRFNKKDHKNLIGLTLPPHPASTAKQASYSTSQLPHRRLNSMPMLPPHNSLPQLPILPTPPYSANTIYNFISLWPLGCSEMHSLFLIHLYINRTMLFDEHCQLLVRL